MDQFVPIPSDSQVQSECSPQAFEGVDTLVLLRVINHGLSGLDGHNSRLTLNLALRVTLIRGQDRSQLSGFYAQYESLPRKFAEWAVNDAQPLRSEFERAMHNLAEQIVSQSRLHLPEPPQTPIGIVQLQSPEHRRVRLAN